MKYGAGLNKFWKQPGLDLTSFGIDCKFNPLFFETYEGQITEVIPHPKALLSSKVKTDANSIWPKMDLTSFGIGLFNYIPNNKLKLYVDLM